MGESRIGNSATKIQGSLEIVQCYADVRVHGSPNSRHVICVYCDDSWAKDDVGKVLYVLARDMKLTVSAYKTDANVSGYELAQGSACL